MTAEHSESAVRRSLAYSLLARSFSYPDAAALRDLQDFARTVQPMLAGTCIADLADAALAVHGAQLLHEHVQLFTLSCSPDCPAFESAFVCTQPAEQTALMARVAGFYRAFGVETQDIGIRPDDIRVELEFAGYLCRKEALAIEHFGAPRVGQARKAQRIFLAEHLARWAPGLGRRVMARTRPGSFYHVLGAALVPWIEQECEALRTGPIAFVDDPTLDLAPPPPEPEDAASEDGASPARLIALDEIPSPVVEGGGR
jgi:TorA maturation chaperone TorD